MIDRLAKFMFVTIALGVAIAAVLSAFLLRG